MLSRDALISAIPDALQEIDLPGLGPKESGKVRAIYRRGDRRVLITTDRISAFDRVLGTIPFKGQVLNQLSAWWFEQTQDIVPNHVIDVPDPNVTIAREAVPLPIEVVVRGYITGITSTSLWTLYARGRREMYGVKLPDGLRKNDPLPEPLITPTTKARAGEHDQPVTPDEIQQRGLLREGLWQEVAVVALALFARGQQIAARSGMILVDTKYEFGLVDGRLTLVDEIHTPDSSRFWLQDGGGAGAQPQHLDKEFLRAWFAEQGYRGEGVPPTMPADIVAEVARRYLMVYERLTGDVFEPGEQPAAERIRRSLTRAGLGAA